MLIVSAMQVTLLKHITERISEKIHLVFSSLFLQVLDEIGCAILTVQLASVHSFNELPSFANKCFCKAWPTKHLSSFLTESTSSETFIS